MRLVYQRARSRTNVRISRPVSLALTTVHDGSRSQATHARRSLHAQWAQRLVARGRRRREANVLLGSYGVALGKQASRALELPHPFDGRSAKMSTTQKQSPRSQRIGAPSSRSGQRGWTGLPPSTSKERPLVQASRATKICG